MQFRVFKTFAPDNHFRDPPPVFSSLYQALALERRRDENLLNVVHDKSLIDEEMIDGYGRPFQDGQIFKAMTRFIRHREGDLEPEQLKKMNKPALLIWGEEDRIVPVEIGKRSHEDLPDSVLYSLGQTGHLVPEERPEFVSEHIAEFIK